jgi:hypothetical protein
MVFIWSCRKCEKEYPYSGEGLVTPLFFSSLLSTRIDLRCVCGGEVDLLPNLGESSASESVSNLAPPSG